VPWLATWFHKTLQVCIRWGKWDATLSKTDKTKLMGGWWTASWVRDSSDKGFVVVQVVPRLALGQRSQHLNGQGLVHEYYAVHVLVQPPHEHHKLDFAIR